MKAKLLLVDDEKDNLEALERVFRQHFEVFKALSGPQALRILDEHPDIPVILSDQRMPEMTGVEFFHEAMKTHPKSIRLLLTGFTDVESLVAAINEGQIYRYLTKPWDPVDLVNTVKKAHQFYIAQFDLEKKNLELEKALNELKTLDQAKNNFMILINHELKTPLTSILSFSDLVLESNLDSEQRQCVERIRKAGARLHQLIHDVMVIVSGEMKTFKVKVETFLTPQLNFELPSDYRSLIENKNLKVTWKLPEEKLIGDLKLIREVIHRVLQNAIKHAHPKSEITIESRKVRPHRTEIFIKNEGPAVPPLVLDKIFNPFFIDENVMNHSTGTGLGLTYCQVILKAHQSHLSLTNVDDGVIAAFELSSL